jgi:hypothetical protein
VTSVRRYLPRWYVEGFVDPNERVGGSPAVWVHRPVIGVFQAAPVEPDGPGRHFNVVEEPELRRHVGLDLLLADVEADAARLVREKISRRVPLARAEREVLAAFFTLLGIRLSSRLGDLDEREARRGHDALLPVLRDMGWVFWEARTPDYFVSSSAPFHVAFPGDDGLVQGMELHACGVEITLPLSPTVALHATWKRRGETWRSASEDVSCELNARTLLRARKFVLAPKPAIPG